MTTRALETLTAEQVREIAAASEAWQQEQQARLDSAGIGEQMGDGRAVITSEHTEAIFAELWNSPTRLAFRKLIADLEPKARLELIALMWIGRGDTDDDDFLSTVEEARRTSDAGDVDYVAAKGPLARYLRAGPER